MDTPSLIRSLRSLCDAWDALVVERSQALAEAEDLRGKLLDANAHVEHLTEQLHACRLRLPPDDHPPAVHLDVIDLDAGGITYKWAISHGRAALVLWPRRGASMASLEIALAGTAGTRRVTLDEMRTRWPDARAGWEISAMLVARAGDTEHLSSELHEQLPHPAGPAGPAGPADGNPADGDSGSTEFARPEWSADWADNVTWPQPTDPSYVVPDPTDAIRCRSIAELQEACRRHPGAWKIFERWQLDRPNIVLEAARRVIIRDFVAKGSAGRAEHQAIIRLVKNCSEIYVHDGLIEDADEVIFGYDVERSVFANLTVHRCHEFCHIWHQPGKGRVLEGCTIADNTVLGLRRHGIELQGGRLKNDGGNLDSADVMTPQVRDLLILRNYIEGGDMALSLATSGGIGGVAIGNKARNGRPMYELMGEWYLERNHAIDRASDCAMFWPNLNALKKMTIGPGNIAERSRAYRDYANGPGRGPAERVQLAPVLTIDAQGQRELVSKLW